MHILLIESQYWPPIQAVARMILHEEVLIEQHEHYVKGTYRNRCYVPGPNGILRLTVPLSRGKNDHTAMKDVRISYDHNWQKLHWDTLCASYRSSSYFEFYEDIIAPIYSKNYEFLLDLNMDILDVVQKILGFDFKLKLTESYEMNPGESLTDYRDQLSPKESKNRIEPHYHSPKFHQVFESKQGFIPNTSIFDLLCNEGSGSLQLLKDAYPNSKA